MTLLKITAQTLTPLLLVILIAGTAYRPGLTGGFLFDDFANLPALGSTGPIHSSSAFWRYITSGTADPTGRPLALLTFLLDANDWPALPYPFKRTNLLLHLLNGLLLFALLLQLGRGLKFTAQRTRIAATFGTATWILHPLFVSTTLYVVQREAMLPATCSMIGLLVWMYGRTCLANERTTAGVIWCIFGLVFFSLLGVLSKANGALLPVFALLIERVVLAPYQPLSKEGITKIYRTIESLLMVLPTGAILGYLVWKALRGIEAGGLAPTRTWSIAQRLMTEPHVLLDYLKLLWLPRPFSSGLFNDQFIVSRSLTDPFITLPSILVVFSLMIGAWLIRKKYPALSLAVLFFFAGHLLESSSIPLELYFEHRNYVPALLMFWPLGLWLGKADSLQLPKYAFAIVIPLLLGCMTYVSAQVWGNDREQALIWARINPESPRAQTYAAEVEMQTGQANLAAQRIEYWLAKKPDEAQLAINSLAARCMTSGVEVNDLSAARLAMSKTHSLTSLFTRWFETILPTVLSRKCPGLRIEGLSSLIDAAIKNPYLDAPGQKQDLIYLRGRLALAQHQPDAALSNFSSALNLEVRPDFALEEAAQLGAAGYPSYGLILLKHYNEIKGQEKSPSMGMPAIHAWVLSKQRYWENEQARIQDQLTHDAKISDAKTPQSD